jgi:mono/diheme cytochrome c family protein
VRARRNGSQRKQRSIGAWLGGVAALAWLTLAAPPSAGQTPTAAPADPELARGELLYRIHCASCHGPQGKGDGPVAAALTLRPSDLTTATLRAGGVFPEAELSAIIDGRTVVSAHGARDMPVWGLSFADRGRVADQEREIAADLRALVRHLRALQRR